MDFVRSAVLDCRSHALNDEELIENLNNLSRQHGSRVFQVIFQIFTGLELSIQSAEIFWKEVLHHRRKMSYAIGRSIDLIPAVYDYLSLSEHPLDNPRLIEEKSYAKVIKETTHDSLTSLFNRHYFNEVLEQAFSSARRYNNDLALLFIDIDDFKEINDTHGHQYGDTILRQVAHVISTEKRDSDIAARYGGEEFVLLMPQTQSINAFILAERIRSSIVARVSGSEEYPANVTISGGLASFPQNCNTPEELVNRADSALYLAKGAGKNIISMYKEEKRRYLRVKYEEPVKIKKLGFDSAPVFTGTSKDICIGGILFENHAPLPIGSRIQVNLPIRGDSPLLLIGTVVRIESFGENLYDIGMTISFKEMEKIANNEIANFLQKSTK
ncbi:MAG: diguanylate cyclase [Desulfopila sp.]|jgi:diguanylate cyclase (GGDEF)-like protein|nr:diguanylate cyclase [Desulfopila sp.]